MKRPRKFLQLFQKLLLAVTAVIVVGTARGDIVVHVSPTGHDGWTGRLAQPNADLSDGPVPSLALARDRVRGLRAADGGRRRGGR